ncbi:response regulator transcription factor [Mesorhizobium sp. GR13]|uniref:LuxR family transcriptional regulator n=1 Tax=Mesorhizobium sp. GR13 TaxID=2562308 RepID=UPI0010C036F6|nr:response regulator transcription factor [Mesorhizobium sp. GR13]
MGIANTAIKSNDFLSIAPNHLRAIERPVAVNQEHSRVLALIDPRALDRECFAQGMRLQDATTEITPFASIQDWKLAHDRHAQFSAILFNIGGRRVTDPVVADELAKLANEFKSIPVIVLADTDDLAQILKALELGARSYIPTSVGITVCVEAIGLALAGGVFVPASSVMGVRQMLTTQNEAARQMAGMFTGRQTEVVEALRRGKANKIIAYELDLRESTVKVHIRNIMRKLKATNRTEVACKINDMFPSDMSAARA